MTAGATITGEAAAIPVGGCGIHQVGGVAVTVTIGRRTDYAHFCRAADAAVGHPDPDRRGIVFGTKRANPRFILFEGDIHCAIHMVGSGNRMAVGTAIVTIANNLRRLGYERTLAVSRLSDIPKRVLNVLGTS